MKNHDNTCTIAGSGNCSCSLDNQPNRDIVEVLNDRARLEREAEHYVDVIEDQSKQIGKLQAMTSGAVSIIGWHIGVWIFS